MKTQLRKSLTTLLKKYNNNCNNAIISNQILLNFQNIIYFFPYNNNSIFSLYYPIDYEINCLRIAKWLNKINIKTALPIIVNGSLILKFSLWNYNNNNLKQGKFNILEPLFINEVIPDIMLIPLLGVDKFGNRLGKGKGYFDATISYYRKFKTIFVIGVAYSFQQVEKIEVTNLDVPLNGLITEDNYFIFNKKGK